VSSNDPTAAYMPCTCTVACIPQGITEEQTCRLRMENESIRVRDLRHLPSCAIFNGSSACSCLAVAEAVKRIPGGAA
jgi:hypothetical protein